jgi:hypothetical protein
MSRSIDTLIGTQSIGNLAELYIVAREQGLEYRLAYIPQSFYAVANEPFDKDYMNKLFRLGQRRAVAGEAWLTLHQGVPAVMPASGKAIRAGSRP